MRLPALALILLLPTAAAGTPDAPESTDPAGDAGPNGAALPAGHDDVDLIAIWFEMETLDTIDLVLQMGGPLKSRPNTIFGVAFDVNGAAKAAAYFDFPPFASGGQICDYSGDLDVENCVDVTASASGNMLRLTIPRANMTSPAPGDAATIVSGVTFSYVGAPAPPPVPSVGTVLTWDESSAGMPYVFAKGIAANLTGGNATSPLAAANVTPSGADAPDEAAVPAAAPALLATAALAAALFARRRAA